MLTVRARPPFGVPMCSSHSARFTWSRARRKSISVHSSAIISPVRSPASPPSNTAISARSSTCNSEMAFYEESTSIPTERRASLRRWTLGGRLPAPMEASTNSSWVGAHDMTTTTSTSGTAITSTPVEGARAPIPAATCLARAPSMSARLSAYHPCRLVLPAGRPREGRAALRFACARQRCSSPQPPAAGSLSIARPPSPARSRCAPRARHVRGARRRHALRGRDPHCDRCRLQICPGRHRHRHQRHRHADVREGRVMRGYLRAHLRQRRSCHRQVQQLRMRLPGLGARHPRPRHWHPQLPSPFFATGTRT